MPPAASPRSASTAARWGRPWTPSTASTASCGSGSRTATVRCAASSTSTSRARTSASWTVSTPPSPTATRSRSCRPWPAEPRGVLMSRIDEKLKSGAGPIVSFEFGPPRTVEAELAFWAAIEELAELEPAFVSVTCGAGGSTRDLTLAVVRRLARERRLEAVPHVTATGFTRAGLSALLAEARAGGADNVLALRGDPPRGQATWRAPEGGGQSALGLTSLAAQAGVLRGR